MKQTSKMNELRHELDKLNSLMDHDLQNLKVNDDSVINKVIIQYLSNYKVSVESIINICETRGRY